MSRVPLFVCKHGKTDKEPCNRCHVKLLEEYIGSAERNLARYRRELEDCNRRIAEEEA